MKTRNASLSISIGVVVFAILSSGCTPLVTHPSGPDGAPGDESGLSANAAARDTWNPGSPHPTAHNVVAATGEGEWEPAVGYAFVDRVALTVAWVPGTKHPTAANIVASSEPGRWAPEEGFEWIDSTPSWEIHWVPGKRHTRFSHVVAAERIDTWHPEAGYSWLRPELKELQHVRWTPGLSHPATQNVVAGVKDGEWNAADGYEWVDPRAISLDVRRKSSNTDQPKETGVDWAGAMIKAFEAVGTDIDSIERKARSYSSPSSWRWASDFDVGVAGAGACVIPGVGAAALPAEFLYLMRQMYNSALGIGFIVSGTAAPSDFPNILAVWSDELTLDDHTLKAAYEIAEHVVTEVGEQIADSAIENSIKRLSAKNIDGHPLAVLSGRMTTRASVPMASSALALKSGAKVGGKLGAKVAAKSGTKIGAKYVAKGIGSLTPISAAVCAGVNVAIMHSLLNSAELYFRKTLEYRTKRYGRE